MPLHPPPCRAVRIGALIATSMALVLSLPGVATAAPGDLDPSFGGDGVVNIAVAPSEFNEDVLVQPDGKILTLSSGEDPEIPSDFYLLRRNADGSPDTTFGNGGVVVTDFGGSADEARGMGLIGGKIVAVGTRQADSGDAPQIAAARYNMDGSLDTSFGGDGTVLTRLGGTVPTSANVVLSGNDGGILVGGVYGGNAMVASITAAGVPEAGFGEDGSGKTVFTFAGGESAINDMTFIGGEQILAVGSSPAGFGLMRFYQVAGGPDPTFGDNGKVASPFGNAAQSVAVHGADRYVVAGSSGSGAGSEFAVARYDFDGNFDTTFDGDGRVTTGFGGSGAVGNDMAVQADGKIVVAGGGNGDVAVARYNTNGSLDTTFGGDGRVTTDLGRIFDEAHAVALQSDGKIVVSGSNFDDQALVRYLVDAGPPPPPSVDVSVTKTGPATVSLGDSATYTIRVTNNSTTTTATAVSISDTLT
ncbi:calcium-binding protein, partial [Streptomyces sp. NPDC048629]